MDKKEDILQPKSSLSSAAGGAFNKAEVSIQPPIFQLKANVQNSHLVSDTNNTGLSTQLKSGIEGLSGFSLDDVDVHYNSNKPTQLQAHAYAQGTDIHLAPGQEKHLPHEAWHIVQQKQGRVQPTTQLKAFNINDDAGLEKEADVMGEKANSNTQVDNPDGLVNKGAINHPTYQLVGNGKNQTSGELIKDLTSERADVKGPIAPDELSYLLEEAAIAAIKTYAYHATKVKNLAGILKGGLDPDFGGTGASKGDSKFEEQSKNKVHYARNLGTAADYKTYFEGGTPFGKEKIDADPSDADILQIALHSDVIEGEEVDPDSTKGDKAFTSTKKISPLALKSMMPKDIPDSKGELTPGEDAEGWINFVQKGEFESEALLSNMSEDSIALIDSIVESSDVITKNVLIQLIKQGLKSMKTDDIVNFGKLLKMGYSGRAAQRPTGEDTNIMDVYKG